VPRTILDNSLLINDHMRSALFSDITQCIVVIPLPTFRNDLSVSSSKISRNGGKELSLYAAYYSRRVQLSCVSLQKPEIKQFSYDSTILI